MPSSPAIAGIAPSSAVLLSIHAQCFVGWQAKANRPQRSCKCCKVSSAKIVQFDLLAVEVKIAKQGLTGSDPRGKPEPHAIEYSGELRLHAL